MPATPWRLSNKGWPHRVEDRDHLLPLSFREGDTIGRYAAGQFFASVTGAFRGSLKNAPEGDEPMRWYSVLHLFDREGNHVLRHLFRGHNG